MNADSGYKSGDDADFGTPQRPAHAVQAVDDETLGDRFHALLLSLTFGFHVLVSLLVGGVLLIAPEVLSSPTPGSNFQYQRFVGVAVACFGVVGPLMGLFTSSRQALVMLLRLELLWTGGCAVVAAMQNADVTASDAKLCIMPVHTTDGQVLTGCVSLADGGLVAIVVSAVLFTSYAYHLLYDDLLWVKDIPAKLLQRLHPEPVEESNTDKDE